MPVRSTAGFCQATAARKRGEAAMSWSSSAVRTAPVSKAPVNASQSGPARVSPGPNLSAARASPGGAMRRTPSAGKPGPRSAKCSHNRHPPVGRCTVSGVSDMAELLPA